MVLLNLQLFGGRGASSLPTGKAGGGNNNNGKWSNGVGFLEHATLKDAIGRKGRAKSIYEAAAGANPGYDNTGTYSDYNENCQRCVVAYELRRRGYNVIAQPTYSGDKLKTLVGNNGRWQGAFQRAKTVMIRKSTARAAQNAVEAKMKSYGNGARGVLGVQWKKGGGHVLNMEVKNGRVMYVDAQAGIKYNGKQLFSQIKSDRVRVVRTDNLRVSERAKKSVTTRDIFNASKKVRR